MCDGIGVNAAKEAHREMRKRHSGKSEDDKGGGEARFCSGGFAHEKAGDAPGGKEERGEEHAG